MAETISIPAKFNGPPNSGHGGYTCGVVANLLEGDEIEVSLRAPPPLDRPLVVSRPRPNSVELRDGETLVAEGTRATIDVDPPDPVPVEAARQSAAPELWAEGHPFPTCYACGPDRAEGEGLRLFPGPVEGEEMWATSWSPDPGLGEDGEVRPEIVWAALDCPSSGPAGHARSDRSSPIMLGRLGTRLIAPVRAGEEHSVQAWVLEVDGRKFHSASAILTAAGEPCAVARALWIELRK